MIIDHIILQQGVQTPNPDNFQTFFQVFALGSKTICMYKTSNLIYAKPNVVKTLTRYESDVNCTL